MLEVVDLIDEALTTVESVYTELHQPPLDHRYKIIDLINLATADMEGYLTRVLKARVMTWRLEGTGARAIYLPEWPVHAVTVARYWNTENTEYTDLDRSGLVADEAGKLILAADAFPRGTSNVEVTAEVGYKPGVDDMDLLRLRGLCDQAAAFKYQRWLNGIAATDTVSAGPSSAHFRDRLPETVLVGLGRYARVE